VAVNCSVAPTVKLGVMGIMDMEDRVAEATVKMELPKILPEAAPMVAVPGATAVARPLPLTVATDVLEEPQATCVVISWLVPSEFVPVAVNCWVTPAGMLAVGGVTEMVDRLLPSPHLLRHIAKEPRNNIMRKHLMLFMGISLANQPVK
jgi:hypothetical protein